MRIGRGYPTDSERSVPLLLCAFSCLRSSALCRVMPQGRDGNGGGQWSERLNKVTMVMVMVVVVVVVVCVCVCVCVCVHQ